MTTKPCPHECAVPYEYLQAKKYRDPDFNKIKYDLFASNTNANCYLLQSIFCLKCKKIIPLEEIKK